MTTAFFLFGDLDTTGFLIILLIALASIGGLVFVTIFIFSKVFRSRGQDFTTINLSQEKGREDERR